MDESEGDASGDEEDAEDETGDCSHSEDEVDDTDMSEGESTSAEEEAKDDALEDDEAQEDSFLQVGSSWKPEPCSELEPGVPCVKLYEHPQGSTFVSPCPVDSHTSAEGCSAYFGDKPDAEKCPQISCPKA